MDGMTRAPWWLQSPYVEQLREVLNREPKQQLVPYRQRKNKMPDNQTTTKLRHPFTVRRLRELLAAAPDFDALVMLECDDEYYSGPIVELEHGVGLLMAPIEYTNEFGQARQTTEGWVPKSERDSDPVGLVRERRKAIILRVS